jgi:hypothetical protein
VVSVLARGPMGFAAAAEDGGFLWLVKIPITHFIGSKAVGPMS